MELDNRRPYAGGGGDLGRIRRDKQRAANARRMQFGTKPGQCGFLPGHIQPAFGRALLALFRHQAAGVGANLERQRQHFGRRRHLEIERQRHFRLQATHIRIPNMAAILAQMGGDAIRSRLRRQLRRRHRARMHPTPRIAQGGHMVNIHAKPHSSCVFCFHGVPVSMGVTYTRPRAAPNKKGGPKPPFWSIFPD